MFSNTHFILAFLALGAACTPPDPASLTQKASDAWGPLAVVDGPPNGDFARMPGVLRLTDRCAMLELDTGDLVLLAWPVDESAWRPDTESVVYQRPSGGAVEVQNGTLAAIQLPTLAPSVGFGPEVTEEPSPSPSPAPTDPTQSPSPLPSLVGAPDAPIAPPDAAALRELAERYRLDDPPQDVEFERYISPEEYAAVMVPCLTEQGIPVRALPDGGVGFDDWPEEQWLLQAEAVYRCHVRFPTHPMFEEPLSDDQLRRLYSYLVDDLTPCLEDQGYATTAPPAVEVFIETYPVGNAWSPWPANDPRLHDEEEWYRLNVACPQSPSLEFLYGDAVSP